MFLATRVLAGRGRPLRRQLHLRCFSLLHAVLHADARAQQLAGDSTTINDSDRSSSRSFAYSAPSAWIVGGLHLVCSGSDGFPGEHRHVGRGLGVARAKVPRVLLRQRAGQSCSGLSQFHYRIHSRAEARASPFPCGDRRASTPCEAAQGPLVLLVFHRVLVSHLHSLWRRTTSSHRAAQLRDAPTRARAYAHAFAPIHRSLMSGRCPRSSSCW